MNKKQRACPQRQQAGLRGGRVICAMSGGVDSSVAAALLKKQGYEVIGIFMKLWADSKTSSDTYEVSEYRLRENICCSVEAATAARTVANKLKIPFYIVNFAEKFKKAVVDYYIKEYEEGRTPNPCVVCNRDIKNELLMNKVKDLDGDFLATGHYARIKKIKDKYQFWQAKDETKDQTYFLWTLTQDKLAKILFPVGDYTKTDVRLMAAKMNLPTAKRKESQGICFIPDRDVCGFLRRHAQKLTEPGEIRDLSGIKIGMHSGLINYTIGQRERLGIGGSKAYYVLKLNSKENILIVGDDGDLYKKTLIAENLNWINPQIAYRKSHIAVKARIRYRHPIEECIIEKIDEKRVKVTFKKAQRAITPGQSIVFYEDEKVLGGGVIE